jgi:hypothetical protein
VTEADYLTCSDPTKLLDYLRADEKLSERKARLFAVACCRRIWHVLTDERSRQAVEVAERLADGHGDATEVDVHYDAAFSVFSTAKAADSYYGASDHTDQFAFAAAAWSLHPAPDQAFPRDVAGFAAEVRRTHPDPGISEKAAQCNLLRDLFADPRASPARLDPAWLAWNDGTVVRLAEGVYDERDPTSGYLNAARLGVLADALEDAGATETELLAHLRGPGPHVRGCWAVDALLGKS